MLASCVDDGSSTAPHCRFAVLGDLTNYYSAHCPPWLPRLPTPSTARGRHTARPITEIQERTDPPIADPTLAVAVERPEFPQLRIRPQRVQRRRGGRARGFFGTDSMSFASPPIPTPRFCRTPWVRSASSIRRMPQSASTVSPTSLIYRWSESDLRRHPRPSSCTLFSVCVAVASAAVLRQRSRRRAQASFPS